MTRKLGIISIIASAFIFGLTTSVFAQSVVVTPKKVIYRREKPEVPFKKTFTITYPKISGVSVAVKNKLESALDYQKVFDFTIEEERTKFQWLSEAFYKVNVNRAGVLSVSLTISGVGAYPSTSTKHLNFDTRTGDPIRMSKDAKDSGALLIAKLNELLNAEVSKYKALYKQPKYDVADPDSLFGELEGFTAENLQSFTVGAKGVTFHYDYGFPHVIQALQPPGEFFLPWSALKPYIIDLGVIWKLSQ